MAGKRKAEGIALLSVYNDDEDMEDLDDDDEEDETAEELAAAAAAMEEEEEEQNEQRQEQQQQEEEDDEKKDQLEKERQPSLSPSSSSSPPHFLPPPPATPPPPEASSLSSLDTPPAAAPGDVAARSSAYGIVDYEHDEAALSPEAEEGEILSTGRAVYGQDLQASNGSVQERTPPGTAHLLTPSKVTISQTSDQVTQLKVGSETQSGNSVFGQEVGASLDGQMNGAEVVDAEASEADPLADFLPPPPTSKCSDELQSKFSKYLALKNAGRSFNEELRKSKGYRNPDFLQRAVKYQGIDQIGTCFRKEIFDPHGYDSSDFYDALALELRREMERKEQEKKRSQRVDFVHGGQSVAATVLPESRSKPIVPILGGQKGVSAVTSQGVLGVATSNSSGSSLHASAAANETSGKTDGRSSKKSKWDKVDGDGRAPPGLPAGAKDAIAAANAHAAMITANAGGGYASYVQQKRKEAEERSRSSEKGALKSEKKSEKS